MYRQIPQPSSSSSLPPPALSVYLLLHLFINFCRAQKTLKAAVESQADVSTNSRNPFQARPSSSRALALAAATLDKAMSELDDDQHMPEGLNYDTWRKLVALRRLKVEKEQQVGLLALSWVVRHHSLTGILLWRRFRALSSEELNFLPQKHIVAAIKHNCSVYMPMIHQ